MDAEHARELLAGARVARFATVAENGRPHLVPVCFVLDGGTVFHAVDHKAKTTRRLARVANIEREPLATLLVDEYVDDDWSALWWVRVDGRARVADGAEAERALDELVERYAQYRDQRPAGPVIALDIERITGWAAR